MEAIAPSVLAGKQIGKQIDHYLLESLVATTTVCSIYRGTDLRTRRAVALKIPHPEVEGDLLFYWRFCREQEIGRKLNHPAIVEFIDSKNSSKFYLAMEWVEGRSLRVVLSERGKLPVERALRIAAGICEALEHIHGQGVVHRDLKPENVMVDAEDRIKLIDFGVASLAGSRRMTFGKLSQVMGTPDYISPEQVQGKRGDARSDLYALGVMLYEMLTGATPFPGDNVFAIMNRRLHQRPIPPREVNPDLSPALQEILDRALERDPRKRYASAQGFSWDLQHHTSTGCADRSAAVDRLDPPRERMPWSKAALAYGGLALIPLSLFALLFYVARHG